MLKSVKLRFAVFGALAIVATAASAAPVTNVIGTGNPPTGVPGNLELNWTISPDFTGEGSAGLYIVSGPADYPLGTWVDPITSGLTAKWISPQTNANHTLATNDPFANTPPASMNYVYTLTGFDKPGDITIKWSSDNGATFKLNGNPLSTIGDTAYGSLTTFAILASNAFWAPTGNKFEVFVTNLGFAGPNPTGLLVDISTVPLPPALLLFGSALVGMNWLRRRRAEKPALTNAYI